MLIINDDNDVMWMPKIYHVVPCLTSCERQTGYTLPSIKNEFRRGRKAMLAAAARGVRGVRFYKPYSLHMEIHERKRVEMEIMHALMR